jgi:hypothetical protein
MPGEADNIGTLSVDVTADTKEASEQLNTVEALLHTIADLKTVINVEVGNLGDAVKLVEAAARSVKRLKGDAGETPVMKLEITKNVTFQADTKLIETALKEIGNRIIPLTFSIANIGALEEQLKGLVIPINAVIDSVDVGDAGNRVIRGSDGGSAGQSEARQQLASKLEAHDNALGKMVDTVFSKIQTGLKGLSNATPLDDATDSVGRIISLTKRFGPDWVDTRIMSGVQHGAAKPTLAETREAKKRGAFGTESDLDKVIGRSVISSIRPELVTIQQDLLNVGRSAGSGTGINFVDLINKAAEETRRTATPPPVRPATTPERTPATGPATASSTLEKILAVAAARAKGAPSYEPIDTGMDTIRKIDFNKIIESTLSNGIPRTHESVQGVTMQAVYGGELDAHGKFMERTGSERVRRGRNVGLQARTETDAEGARVGDLLYAEMGAGHRGRGVRTHGETIHVKDEFGEADIPVLSRARSTNAGRGDELRQAEERLEKARKAVRSYQAEDEDIKLELADVMEGHPKPGETKASFIESEVKTARSRAARARGAAKRVEESVYDDGSVRLLDEPKWKKFNATRVKSLLEQASADEAYAADVEAGKVKPKLDRKPLPADYVAQLNARQAEIRTASEGLTHSQPIDILGDDWVEGPRGEPVHPVVGKKSGGPSRIKQLEIARDKARREVARVASAEESTQAMINREAEEAQPYEESKAYGPLRGGGVDLVNLQHMANLKAFKDRVWIRTHRRKMTPTFDATGKKIGMEPAVQHEDAEGKLLVDSKGNPAPIDLYEDVVELAEITPQIRPRLSSKRGTRENSGEAARTIFGHSMWRADETDLFRTAAGRIAAAQGADPSVGYALVDTDLARGQKSTVRKSLRGGLHFASGNVGDVGASVMPSEADKALDRSNKARAQEFRDYIGRLQEDSPDEARQVLDALRLKTYEMREVSRQGTRAGNKASRIAVKSGATRELNRTQLSNLFQAQGRDPLDVLQETLTTRHGIETGQLPNPKLITEALEAIAYSKEPLRSRFTGHMPKPTPENPYPTYVPTGFKHGAITQELGRRVGAILRKKEYGGDTDTDFSQLSPQELAKRLRSAKTPEILVNGQYVPSSGGLGYLADMVMDAVQVAYAQADDSGHLVNDNKLVGLGARSNSVNVSDRRTGLGRVPATGSEPMAERRIAVTAQAEYNKKRRGINMQGEISKREAKIKREAEGRLIGGFSELKGMFADPTNGAAVMDEVEAIERAASMTDIGIKTEVDKEAVAAGATGRISRSWADKTRKRHNARRAEAQKRLAAIGRVRNPSSPAGDRKSPSWQKLVNDAAAPALEKLKEQAEREREATEKSLLEGRGPKPEGIFYSASKAQLDPNLGEPLPEERPEGFIGPIAASEEHLRFGRRTMNADAARFQVDPDVEAVLASFGRAMGPGAGFEVSPGTEAQTARGRRSEVGLAREQASRRHSVAITGLHQRDLTEEEFASIAPERPKGFVGPIRPSPEDELKLRSTFQPVTGEQLLNAPGSESWTERQKQIARELVEEKNDHGVVTRLRGPSQIGVPKTRDTRDPNAGDAGRAAARRVHAGRRVGEAHEEYDRARGTGTRDTTTAPAELMAELMPERPVTGGSRILESATYQKAQRDLAAAMEEQAAAHQEVAKATEAAPGPGIGESAEARAAQLRRAKTIADAADSKVASQQVHLETIQGVVESPDSTYVNPRFRAGAGLLAAEDGVPSSARSPMREQASGGGGGFPSRIDVNVLNWPEALLMAGALGGGGGGKPPAPPEGTPEETPEEEPARPRNQDGRLQPLLRGFKIGKSPITLHRPMSVAHSPQERAITAEAEAQVKEFERIAKEASLAADEAQDFIRTPGGYHGARERSPREVARRSHRIRMTPRVAHSEAEREAIAQARSQVREFERIAAQANAAWDEQHDYVRTRGGYYGPRSGSAAALRAAARASARPTAAVRGAAFDDTDEDIFSQEQAKADELMKKMRGQTRMANRKVPKRGFGASVTDLITGILGGPGFENQLESIGLMERQQSEVNSGQMANAKLRTKMRTTQGRLNTIGMTPVAGEAPEIAAERTTLLEKMSKFQERHDKNTVAINRSTEAYEKNRKVATSFGTVLSSYRAAFVGSAVSVGMGAISTGLGMAIVGPLMGAMTEGIASVIGPTIERALGRPGAAAQVVGVGDQAVIAGRGNAELASGTFAQSMNMTASQMEFIGKPIMDRATIEQGNKSLANLGGAIQAYQRLSSEGAAFQPGMEMQTPQESLLAAVPFVGPVLSSFAKEQRVQRSGVAGVGSTTSGIIGTAFNGVAPAAEIIGGLFDNTIATDTAIPPSEITMAGAPPDIGVGQYLQGMNPFTGETPSSWGEGTPITMSNKTAVDEYTRKLGVTNNTIGSLNEALKRGGEETVKFTAATKKYTKTELDAQAALVDQLGPQAGGLANKVREGKVAFEGPGNELITDPDAIARALTSASVGSNKPDYETLLQVNKHQIETQFKTEDLRGQMALGKGQFEGQGILESQYGIELAQNPIGSATSGIAKQDQRGLKDLGTTKKLYAEIDAEAEKGVATANAFVSQWLEGNPVVEQFAASLEKVQDLGTSISNIQIGRENVHAEYAAKQYNFQLFQMNRSYRDAVNLRKAAFGGGGSGLGGIQGQQWALQRQSTALGLGMSQKQINFQKALAGFVTPGDTPQERAARIDQAKIEAAYAQKQLDIQKKLYGLEGKAFKITVDRSVYDLSRQIGLLTQGRAITIDDAVAQKKIKALNLQMGKEMKIVNEIFGQAQTRANDMLELSSKFATELVKDVAYIFKLLIGYYDDYYDNLPVNRPTPQGGNTRKTEHAAGVLFNTSGETDMTVGEAGTETVAVLRNPRQVSPSDYGQAMGGSSGGSYNVYVSVTGNTVRSDSDIDALVYKIERKLSQKAAMLGYRRVV